jgi:hypothetical protein
LEANPEILTGTMSITFSRVAEPPASTELPKGETPTGPSGPVTEADSLRDATPMSGLGPDLIPWGARSILPVMSAVAVLVLAGVVVTGFLLRRRSAMG